MLKIRRPLGRLIFNMGIAIPGKTVFLIETAPRWARTPGKGVYVGGDVHYFGLIIDALGMQNVPSRAQERLQNQIIDKAACWGPRMGLL